MRWGNYKISSWGEAGIDKIIIKENKVKDKENVEIKFFIMSNGLVNIDYKVYDEK